MNLFFVQLIFLTVITTVYLIHDDAIESESLGLVTFEGMQIDESHNTVELLIQRKRRKYIKLKLKPTKQQTLANNNLPVRIIDDFDRTSFEVRENVFNVTETVGNFRTYHDVEKTSAVVYFEKTQTFYGVIGSKYYIMGLPLNLTNECQEVGGEYVKIYTDGDHHSTDDSLPPLTDIDMLLRQFTKREATFNQHNVSNIVDNRKPKTEKYYVETLVFLTHSITQHYRNADPSSYLTKLVMDNIVYLNAVDMMYAKLRLHGFKIHINLAGMMIENAPGVLNPILSLRYLKQTSDGTYILPENSIHDAFRHYLDHVSFPIDSLDLILVMPGHAMLEHFNVTHGMTYPLDIYTTRETKYPDEAIPMIAMQFKYHYNQYCVVAYEIGYALEIFHDRHITDEHERKKQCHRKKLEDGNSCLRCSHWSNRLISQTRTFLRENRNRCFLMNYPRSLLHPEKARTSLVSRSQQCRCYGYESDDSSIPADACEHSLKCDAIDRYGNRYPIPTILPLDGTPCGSGSVCWDEECVDMHINTMQNEK